MEWVSLYEPISTPRPFMPTIRTFDVAIFFMAVFSQRDIQLGWLSLLTFVTKNISGKSASRASGHASKRLTIVESRDPLSTSVSSCKYKYVSNQISPSTGMSQLNYLKFRHSARGLTRISWYCAVYLDRSCHLDSLRRYKRMLGKWVYR